MTKEIFTITASREVLALVGDLLRNAVDQTDTRDVSAYSKDAWTTVEEIATGLDNR